MDILKNIWDFLAEHAMRIWACIATCLVAILTFFSINVPGFLQDYTTTTPTTTVSTSISTSTTTTTQAAPWACTFTLDELKALKECDLKQEVEIISYDVLGTEKHYAMQAYVLKEVLAELGADMSKLTPQSKLFVTNPLSESVEIPYSLIVDDVSYLAISFRENGAPQEGERTGFFPAPNFRVDGRGVYVDESLCLLDACTFVLHYA